MKLFWFSFIALVKCWNLIEKLSNIFITKFCVSILICFYKLNSASLGTLMILSISFTLCGMGQIIIFLLFSILFIINRIIWIIRLIWFIWIIRLIWCWFNCFLIGNLNFLCFTFAFTFLFFNLQFSLNELWYLLLLIGNLLINWFILFFNHLFYLWVSEL